MQMDPKQIYPLLTQQVYVVLEVMCDDIFPNSHVKVIGVYQDYYLARNISENISGRMIQGPFDVHKLYGFTYPKPIMHGLSLDVNPPEQLNIRLPTNTNLQPY